MIKLSKASVAAGLLSFAYSGIGLWQPSFWTDEAATLSAIRRSLPDLTAMLGSVDAVHGGYYFLLYPWSRLWGYSEIAVRLPSVIGVALSAVLMVELGKKLAGLNFGLLAAALMVLMPRTQYVATDARSYALTVLGAVAATFILVSIRENPLGRKWVLYAVVGAVTVSLSFYTVLLLLAHGTTVFWDARLRRHWRGLAAATVGWAVPALYVGIAASRQQFQIAWIRPVWPSFPYELTFLQFFGDGYSAIGGQVSPSPTPGEDFSMYALAALTWTAAAVGVWLCRGHFALKLALPWLIIPAGAVIGGSLLTGGNYYLPRYLSFELPAMALLAGMPAVAAGNFQLIRRRAGAAAATAVALLVCVPSYVGQRTQFGRDQQDDFRYIAETVDKLSSPGDAFVIGPDRDLAFQAYPRSFEGLADPTLGITGADWKRIFNQRYDVITSAPKIRQYSTIVLIEKTGNSAMADSLQSLGYSAGESERGPATTVTRFSRR